MADIESIRPLAGDVYESLLELRSLVRSYSDLAGSSSPSEEVDVHNLIWCVRKRVDEVEAKWETFEQAMNARPEPEPEPETVVSPVAAEHVFPYDINPNPVSKRMRAAKAAWDAELVRQLAKSPNPPHGAPGGDGGDSPK